jgi:hypothetical protein
VDIIVAKNKDKGCLERADTLRTPKVRIKTWA